MAAAKKPNRAVKAATTSTKSKTTTTPPKASTGKPKTAKTKSAETKTAKAKAGTAKPAKPIAPGVAPLLRPKRKPTKRVPPNLSVEKALWAEGYEIVVGIDEVGRGSWAGPLAIGAVVLPRTGRVNGVRDSKMLSEREREALFDRVADWCAHWAVGMVSHEECDTIGMSAAQKLAAKRAIEGLGVPVDRVLIDGNWDFVSETIGPGKTQRIIKGDATCLSISAASVLAKVTRDRLMRLEDEHFPAYNFAENKGYPCPKHKMALQAHGPSAIHRRSWVFMENMPWGIPRRTPFGAGNPDQQSLFD